jgi:hypothetical protein
MTPIKRFTLERHHGPYKEWPTHSRLFLDGKCIGISLPGYELLHQFETSHGYILVTDYDCPFEEITNFALISKDLCLLSCQCLGMLFGSFLLDRIEWIDERTFIAVLYGEMRWRFTIRSWGIPFIRPCLKMKRLAKAKAEDEIEETEPGNSDLSGTP